MTSRFVCTAFFAGALSLTFAASAAEVDVTFFTPSVVRIVRAPGGEVVKKCFWRTKEGRPARCVRRESSGLGLVFTRLDLDKAPSGTVKMLLTGIDNEKESVADIEVKVNSKVVYAGPVKWGKDEHSDWILELPAGLLKSGENEIQFRNTTLDAEAAQDGAGGDAFRATRNYFWGWFYIDKVKFVMAE